MGYGFSQAHASQAAFALGIFSFLPKWLRICTELMSSVQSACSVKTLLQFPERRKREGVGFQCGRSLTLKKYMYASSQRCRITANSKGRAWRPAVPTQACAKAGRTGTARAATPPAAAAATACAAAAPAAPSAARCATHQDFYNNEAIRLQGHVGLRSSLIKQCIVLCCMACAENGQSAATCPALP